MKVKCAFALIVMLSSLVFGLTSSSAITPDSQITLRPGDFYFSVDGTQHFIFSRNLGGYEITQYFDLLNMMAGGGSTLVRIQLDSMGMGYTSTGAVDEHWAHRWEQVFDHAAERGIMVLPVFTGWFDWNNGDPDFGYSQWNSNPMNAANGGPAQTPGELFQPGSETQQAWFAWLQTLIERWQDRDEIVAWEIFSEINIASSTTETNGTAFIEAAADIIRAADAHKRPLTTSLADINFWPNFYHSSAVDFLNFHPYTAHLDTYLIQQIPGYRTTYNKPILIGESGLSAATPDSSEGALTIAENASIGLRHAIWAAMVSGAMNGREFYWEDGFGIYFPALSWDFLERYNTLENPAAQFAQNIDFAGFAPLTSQVSSQIVGGTIGSLFQIVGWYRDAGSEPPDWPLQDMISGQTVTIEVSSTGSMWHVFYVDTQTGTDIIGSEDVVAQGNTVTLNLPDFHDSIAFYMMGLSGDLIQPIPTTDPIAGNWTGTITGDNNAFSSEITISIDPGCAVDTICGTVSTPVANCAGNLRLVEFTGEVFTFVEEDMAGADYCTSGGQEILQLQADGSLSFHFQSDTVMSSGILTRQ